MLKGLIFKNRSYRRFHQEYSVSQRTLRELVEFARLSPSAANLQPLKYQLCRDPKKNAQIFPCLGWAGYLKDWKGPAEGERPSAYIVILGDTTISRTFERDCGIAAQSMLLAAVEQGLGGCMIATLDKEGIRKILRIPEHLEILLVLALGKPNEKVVLEKLEKKGDIKYWRDEKGGHHVPKRGLDEIILPIL